MKIVQIVVGPIGTNCYLLCDEVHKVCAVIDPGDAAQRILAAIAESGCTPQAIYLTHGHFDHFHAVAGLLERYGDLPVYIHEKDVEPYGTKSGWDLFFPKLEDRNQRYYAEGDVLHVGDRFFHQQYACGMSVIDFNIDCDCACRDCCHQAVLVNGGLGPVGA